MTPIISYFGYPTFADYQTAGLVTAHTAQLRANFSETLEQHNRRIQQIFLPKDGRPGFTFDSVIAFIREEWAKNPNAWRGHSIAWYFHHPEARKFVPPDFLAQHDSICGPEPRCLRPATD